MTNTKLKMAILSKFRYQTDFAREAGLTDTKLSGIIRGRVTPFPDEEKAIAETLGCKVEDLFEE